QGTMLRAPADHILDGVAHLVPGGVKYLGGLLPGDSPRPTGQKLHIGPGQLAFAPAPGNLFDHHPTTLAVHPSHAVQQENQKAPQRNELEAALGKMIVTWCRLVAPRADRRRALPRSDVHFDAFLVGAEAGVLVDESPMAMAVV